MSYLQQRLNIDSIRETIKDGSSNNFVGKETEESSILKNNVAKYRHSFFLWKRYLNIHFNSALYNSYTRCTNACISDVKKLSGRSAPERNNTVSNKCLGDCLSEYKNKPYEMLRV
jgi:hypothetical protein